MNSSKFVIFFGSAPISNVVLQLLIDAQIPVAAVVTKTDKPVGRHLKLTPNPVKVLTQKHKLRTYESLTDLEIPQGAVGLVAAYGKIIPQQVLDKFNGQIYNIHPSLLPKYRGPSPLQQQILDGVKDTGATVIQVDAEMDHGPILAQVKDQIMPGDTWQSLGERLFIKGANLFVDYLHSPRKYSLTTQDHSQATYTKLLTRQDGFVPWEEFSHLLSSPSQLLDRKFRAYSPWPGVWSITDEGKRIKLLSLTPKVEVRVV